MKNLFIYLDNCNTCQRIKSELRLSAAITLQNIKEEPVTSEQVEFLKEQAGSYEALFNRRAQLYRGRGLHEKELSDENYRELLLDHYTFIKRPILIYNGEAFIGNSKQVIADTKVALS